MERAEGVEGGNEEILTRRASCSRLLLFSVCFIGKDITRSWPVNIAQDTTYALVCFMEVLVHR